ncbi:hypothetical protein BpHYR1_009121 [Brachionus plicatilis]|uniref:Uncharacterized protein n=1 Tax=Brachionus plicatilis TaxID=10195 RepID=A0A3M7SFS1_BRAPC|nr:hypothetical protein BpHYR1_009121 [Brachionus plicatilis]
MNSGVHELLHLADMSIESGSLNVASCFPFEELNRKLGLMVNGKDLIGDEFIKHWTVSQCLELSFTMQNLISSHFQDKNTVLFYEKISIGSMVFTTENKKARYCNSFIKHGEHFACNEYIATDKANIIEDFKMPKQNRGDVETHSVVFWTMEKKFSIILNFGIHSNQGEKIKEGKEYDASYGKSTYRAIVKYKDIVQNWTLKKRPDLDLFLGLLNNFSDCLVFDFIFIEPIEKIKKILFSTFFYLKNSNLMNNSARTDYYSDYLIFLGSYEKCLEIEKSTFSYNGILTSATSKIQRDSTKETSCAIEILRPENFGYKKKLVELTGNLI